MDAQIDYESAHEALFIFGTRKFPHTAAIIDDAFMIRHGDLITRSNIIIPYLAQESNQHPVQTAMRFF